MIFDRTTRNPTVGGALKSKRPFQKSHFEVKIRFVNSTFTKAMSQFDVLLFYNIARGFYV